jgi:hypothetical protein
MKSKIRANGNKRILTAKLRHFVAQCEKTAQLSQIQFALLSEQRK